MDKIYNSVIESLIFSSDEPINAGEILKAIKEIDGEEAQISAEDIDACVNELNDKYSEVGVGFNILKIAHGYTYATRTENAKYVGFLSTEKSKRRLSQAALETLAIIAYKQPITKPELEAIRGVNADYIMNMLLEKELITITGRAETLGRPLLYGTTNEFLKYFGLFNLSDLPKPREIEEIMQDEYFIEQKRKIMMNALEDDMAREAGDDEDSGSQSESDDMDDMELAAMLEGNTEGGEMAAIQDENGVEAASGAENSAMIEREEGFVEENSIEIENEYTDDDQADEENAEKIEEEEIKDTVNEEEQENEEPENNEEWNFEASEKVSVEFESEEKFVDAENNDINQEPEEEFVSEDESENADEDVIYIADESGDEEQPGEEEYREIDEGEDKLDETK